MKVREFSTTKKLIQGIIIILFFLFIGLGIYLCIIPVQLRVAVLSGDGVNEIDAVYLVTDGEPEQIEGTEFTVEKDIS